MKKHRPRKSDFLFSLFFLVSWVLLFDSCKSLPDKKTVTVSNQSIEYLIAGEGKPAVVFAFGIGGSIDSWDKIIPEISQQTTVFAYNRPGYGKSPKTSAARLGSYLVEELRELLLNRNIKPPYILVGHSYGGLLMQYFARKYPDEVAGLVLVESTHPEHFSGKGSPDLWPKWFRGLYDFFSQDTVKEEFYNINQTGQEVLALPAFSGKPVIVLSALKPLKDKGEIADYYNEKRKNISHLYPGSKQIWVNSNHNIPDEMPMAVIEAIREIIGSK